MRREEKKKQLNKLKVAGINKTRGCECVVPVDGESDPGAQGRSRILNVTQRQKKKKGEGAL